MMSESYCKEEKMVISSTTFWVNNLAALHKDAFWQKFPMLDRVE
uniref:Uncharacterized protein n=1 Tax=Romanomermis culicivorax TaxID=13658 RepID=A0A915KM95_ROMCU